MVRPGQGVQRASKETRRGALQQEDDSATEIVLTGGLSSFLNLYNTVLFGRIILTWFPNPPQVIAGPLSTLADPYLNLFRGIIPPIGGTLDLSPILAFFVLNIFTSSAAALPCEVGPDGGPAPRGPSGAEKAALFVRSSAGHLFRRRRRGPGGGGGIAGVR